MRCVFLILVLLQNLSAEVLFREDFKEVPAHIPVTADDLTSDFLTLERLGPAADRLKLSYHPEIPNDPHYIWNGECKEPVLIAFPFKEVMDLSAKDLSVRLRTKNFAPSTMHIALRSGDTWYVQKKPVADGKDWNVQQIPLHDGVWCGLDPATVAIGDEVAKPDFTKVGAIGFAAPGKANRSKDCIRLDWFELVKGEEISRLPDGGFLEEDTPFLRSALVYRMGKKDILVRRGVLVPIGYGYWACFDTDLLRWAVVWKAPAGEPPLSYDSMAAISFPDKKAKANRPPLLRGEIVYSSPDLPGAGGDVTSDPRLARTEKDLPIGPLPPAFGRWSGIALRGPTPVLRYRVGETEIREVISADSQGGVARLLQVGASDKPLTIRLGKSAYGEEVATLPAANQVREHVFATRGYQGEAIRFPDDLPATPLQENELVQKNPPAQPSGPFAVRKIVLPESERPIRPTDLAFLSDGTCLLCTLDGDVWRIREIDDKVSKWRRVATGIYEPTGIEVWNDRVFVLGRDQITELIDNNGDGVVDEFRNASDAFLQTLHTRDFAMSFEVDDDGSFLIAKGGIQRMGNKNHAESSRHRGAIVRISPDGNTASVLADGLRLPYVGLRADGAVFASDQQGHFVPSTPVYRIGDNRPYLGFERTNHRGASTIEEPLLYYPYGVNRSAAGFVQLTDKAFAGLANAFLQVSWNGRLFGIETPETGQAFSWQMPLQLDFPSLNGEVHPVSGRLYVVGLGISGYRPSTETLIGLASVEQTSPLPVPVAMDVSANRIVVEFHRSLSKEETVIPAVDALRLFNIKRTAKYGSGHFRWDGEPGEHKFQPQEFSLSSDRRKLVLVFDTLRQSDVLDLQLLVSVGSETHPMRLFSRPDHLSKASEQEIASLNRQRDLEEKLKPGDATRGRQMFTQYACAGCHSLGAEELTGPPLTGVATRYQKAFLRESILDPAATITEGYEPAMPSFEGVIPPQDLEDLLAFLQSLE